MNLRYIKLSTSYELEQNMGADFCYIFNFNVTFITDYISRAIRKLKIELLEYNCLSIKLTPMQDACQLGKGPEEKSLIVSINFTKQDKEELDKLDNLAKRFEFYMNLIEKGYQNAVKEGYEEIQIIKLLYVHEMFRKQNYKNEWIWKKTSIREKNIHIVFNCYFTSFYFRLELVAYTSKKDKILVKGVIMNRPPDRICFDKDFKGLSIKSNKLTVLDFLGHPMYEINLKKIQKGIFECHNVDNTKFDFPDLENITDEEVIKHITW